MTKRGKYGLYQHYCHRHHHHELDRRVCVQRVIRGDHTSPNGLLPLPLFPIILIGIAILIVVIILIGILTIIVIIITILVLLSHLVPVSFSSSSQDVEKTDAFCNLS